MKTKRVYLVICAFIISLTGFGQISIESVQSSGQSKKTLTKSNTHMGVQRSITLTNDSKEEEIIITVEKAVLRFDLRCSSTLTSGTLTIEVYDPKGVKQGNLTIGTQLNSSKEEVVNGDIRKSLKEPHAGNWRVKIIPKDVTGEIKIMSSTTK